jgi:hypothetical protein
MQRISGRIRQALSVHGDVASLGVVCPNLPKSAHPKTPKKAGTKFPQFLKVSPNIGS